MITYKQHQLEVAKITSKEGDLAILDNGYNKEYIRLAYSGNWVFVGEVSCWQY